MSSASLRNIADRLADERVKARPVIEALRMTMDAVWDRALPEEWRTLGFVQELTTTAAALLEQDPRYSRALAQFALAVAMSVPRTSYPAVLIAQSEGRAWKELGTAHRYLSEHDAALRAYEAARRSFAEFGALAHDEASLDFAIAIVHSETGRHEEALALLAHATAIFASFRDEERFIKGTLLKAMILHRRGELVPARIIYEDALTAARQRDDLHTLAGIYNNLGQVCIELNEMNAAASALSQARDLFSALNMPAELARTKGALAHVLFHNAAYEPAIQLLQDARDDFMRLGMVEEAGVAALDIVDALVATNERAAAQQLTEIVLAEFRAAQLNERALIALAYLRDFLREHPAPAGAIRHVRSYLQELRTNPARVFLPLPE